MGKILAFLLIAAIVILAPIWPYSRKWGGGPSSLAAIMLFVVAFMLVIGKL
jgi:hypothetical protein